VPAVCGDGEPRSAECDPNHAGHPWHTALVRIVNDAIFVCSWSALVIHALQFDMQRSKLIPQLDQTIPTRRDHLGLDRQLRSNQNMGTYMFIRKPGVVNDDLLVAFKPLGDLARLPVPEHQVAAACSTRNVFAVRGEGDFAGIPSDSVASEALLLDLAEGAVGSVDQDLVVERLARDEFA
jgi:hypothetical protein